jgi:hypothetical protein
MGKKYTDLLFETTLSLQTQRERIKILSDARKELIKKSKQKAKEITETKLKIEKLTDDIIKIATKIKR